MSNFDLTIACAIAMPTVKILVCEIVHDIAYRVQSEKKTFNNRHDLPGNSISSEHKVV